MTPGLYSRAVKTAAKRPAPVALRPVRTEERNGVLYVLGRDGQILAPVASLAIAQTYGAALQRAGIA